MGPANQRRIDASYFLRRRDGIVPGVRFHWKSIRSLCCYYCSGKFCRVLLKSSTRDSHTSSFPSIDRNDSRCCWLALHDRISRPEWSRVGSARYSFSSWIEDEVSRIRRHIRLLDLYTRSDNKIRHYRRLSKVVRDNSNIIGEKESAVSAHSSQWSHVFSRERERARRTMNTVWFSCCRSSWETFDLQWDWPREQFMHKEISCVKAASWY